MSGPPLVLAAAVSVPTSLWLWPPESPLLKEPENSRKATVHPAQHALSSSPPWRQTGQARMKLEAAETRLLAVPSVGGGRGSQSQCTHTPLLSSCLPVRLSACPPAS